MATGDADCIAVAFGDLFGTLVVEAAEFVGVVVVLNLLLLP